MLLCALVLQPLLPAAALSVRAAPLSVTPRQEPPPNPPVVYDEPFAEILPPALSIDGSTPTITLPNLMATVNLDLDRAVLIHGATAALTLTVQGDYATLPAGVILSLTLPPGLVTSAGATGLLQWPLPAAPQSSLFVQSIQLQVDQATLPTPAAVVDLAVQLSAPDYATGYWSATLGIAPVVDSGPIVTTQQDANGAVLQDGTGLLTLLVGPTDVGRGRPLPIPNSIAGINSR